MSRGFPPIRRWHRHTPPFLRSIVVVKRSSYFKSIILCLGVITMGLLNAKAADLQVGDAAPLFTAASSDDKQVELKSLIGKGPIVLYFYPKDDTPGCTKEACGLRDDFAAFRKLKATVFGISYDSIESHKKFIEKYHLPFALLSDSDRAIAKAY